GVASHCAAASLHVPSLHCSARAEQSRTVPPHTPALQVSFTVQKRPSSQAVPSALSGLEQLPLAGSQVPASWHWSGVAQATGSVPAQTPAWQESVWVQALPSLQGVPLALAGVEQNPLAGSQTPASWHWSIAAQKTGFAPVQMPAWQVSVRVQALPSSQAAPLILTGCEQTPFAGSQTPATWHWSGAGQTTGFAPMQVPAWQVSVWVQASPSVQALPLGFSGLEQVPLTGSQTPATWH